VAAARTVAPAAMLKTLKEKAPCWDDVVILPLTSLPGEKQVEYLFSYRASQGTTPLQSISSLAIALVSTTNITKVCTYYLVAGFTRASKANFGNAPTLGEPVVGYLKTNKKAAKTAKPSKKDVVPKFMGNYFCLINCLFHPALHEQYVLFNCQPNKDVLTMKKVANQELCGKILVMYNTAAESLDDD
jgi:hypothetical protein